jgi:hypothetical protein
MRGRLWLVLLLAAGCSRSFRAPRTDGRGPPPHLDSVQTVDPVGAFAGERVVLTGSDFSPSPDLDEVRVGPLRALLDATVAPTSTQLTVLLPTQEATASGQAFDVTVVVKGQTSNALPLTFRGPGHPRGFSLTAGAALAPTPTAVRVLGGVAVISMLRNRIHAVLFDTKADRAISYPASPGALPYGAGMTLTRTGGFGDATGLGYAAWTSELTFDAAGGPPVQVLRSNLEESRPGLALPTVARGRTEAIEATTAFIPVVGGLLDLTDTLDAGLRAGTVLRLDGGGLDVLQSASQLVPRFPDAGGVATAVAVTHLLAGGGAGLTELVIAEGLSGPRVISRDFQELGFLPDAISIDPDGRRVWMLTGSQFGGSSEIHLVDPADGGSTTHREIPEARLIIATENHMVTGEGLSSLISTFYAADGGAGGQLQLPGRPFAFARDDFDPTHLFVLVDSPPSLVEVDPVGPSLVHQTQLTSGLRLEAASRDGKMLALAGLRLPALVTVDAHALGPLGDFQHLAAPGSPDVSEVVSSAFRTVPGDGGVELCAFDVRLDVVHPGAPDAGELFEGLRCGPPELVLEPGGAGCALIPDRPLDAGFGVLAALDGGGLRFFSDRAALECSPGCGPCVALDGWGTHELLAVEPTASGGVLVAERGALRLFDGSTWKNLCVNGDDCSPGEPILGLAIDDHESLAAVLGHLTRIFDLRASDPSQAKARIQYFSDVPLALAFSPDRQRLFVGTLLGHLDEYDLGALESDGSAAPLVPVRTLFAGFPIAQLHVPPEGDRVLLIESGTDRIWVVQ